MITRSRKLSLKLVYQLTHKMMICRSKCRPLNRSSIGLNDCIPHHRPVKARLHQNPRQVVAPRDPDQAAEISGRGPLLDRSSAKREAVLVAGSLRQDLAAYRAAGRSVAASD